MLNFHNGINYKNFYLTLYKISAIINMLKGDESMEYIKFKYGFTDLDHKVPDKKVSVYCDGEEKGLDALDVCEAFVDFMEAAGFSRDNIYDYFQN